jgi:hypothetical protein
MSHDTKKLLTLAHQMETSAIEEFLATAKKKDKKKLDPKAKVRNRGTVCVPAASAKDKQDHFPINSESQARNALARVHQYSSVPSWYNGSLKGLQDAVSRKVHSKYPGIGKSDKKKSSSVSETLLSKYAQEPNQSVQPAEPNSSVDPNAPEPGWQQDHAEQPAPPGQKWTVVNDQRVLVPAATTTTAPAAAAGKFAKIDPIFQTMLGTAPDTQLGPQTQAALDRYKASRKNPGMTNELAFEYLKKEPAYASRSAMQYDDNSNTYAAIATLLSKYAQLPPAAPKADPTNQLNQILAPYGYSVAPQSIKPLPSAQYVDVTIMAGPKAKWQGTGHQSVEVKKLIDPVMVATYGFGAKPVVQASVEALLSKYA